MLTVLTGTRLRGRTWALWGSSRRLGCSNGVDVIGVDEYDPMAYIAVQTC